LEWVLSFFYKKGPTKITGFDILLALFALKIKTIYKIVDWVGMLNFCLWSIVKFDKTMTKAWLGVGNFGS